MTQKGFTLIELLVVVAIIGVLAAVGVVAFNGFINSAKENTVKSHHKNIEKWFSLKAVECEIEGKITNSYGASPSTGLLTIPSDNLPLYSANITYRPHGEDTYLSP